MRILRSTVLGAVATAAAAVVAGAALGAGPWPGLAPSLRAPGGVRYSARTNGATTTIRAVRAGRVVASATFGGAWGIPAVTSTGVAGGLSPDGRLLVLAEPPTYEGLRERSRFLLVSARTLSTTGTIVLRGEFGFDAISPDRGTLYLTQHTSGENLVRYVVRAYDLRARRLLEGAIVDERSPGEEMAGYPVARATSPRGTWVYTLYNRGTAGARPFVHALDAAHRSAFCVDLPHWPAGANVWDARLELTGGTLLVRAPGGAAVARIDTKTLRVR
jgi:hypothetical protein